MNEFIFGCAGSSLLRLGLSLVAASRGWPLAGVHMPLTVVVSRVAEHGL